MARDSILYPTGRTQPHNLEAEQSLLGVLLFESAHLADIDGIVTPESFYDPTHGRIFAAISALVSMGGRADAMTVADRLGADKGLDELGGVRYLADLTERAPPGYNGSTYAEIVREFSQRRQLLRTAEEIEKFAMSGEIRPAEILEHAERDLLAIQMKGRAAGFVNAETAVGQMIDEFDNPAVASGVIFGLDTLDSEIGGLMPGELWLGAGRPGMGKSAFASSVALNIARHGKHADGRPLGVATVNGEMGVSAMMRRYTSDLAFELAPRDAPSYAKLRKRNVTNVERACFHEAARQVAALKDQLQVIKVTGITLSRLRSLMRRQVAAWHRQGIAPGLLIVDHVGLMRPDDPRHQRTEAQTMIAIGLKELAGELGIPILALVQLNREVEKRDDKRPSLPDLRDSGAWEENADGALFFYRDAYYAIRETTPKRADQVQFWESRKASKVLEVIIGKIREGEGGTKELWVDIARNAVRDRQPDNVFGGGLWAHQFEETAASYGLSAPAANPSPATETTYSSEGSTPPADGPEEPPLSAYDIGEFE